jgi:hypothetical protein
MIQWSAATTSIQGCNPVTYEMATVYTPAVEPYPYGVTLDDLAETNGLSITSPTTDSNNIGKHVMAPNMLSDVGTYRLDM